MPLINDEGKQYGHVYIFPSVGGIIQGAQAVTFNPHKGTLQNELDHLASQWTDPEIVATALVESVIGVGLAGSMVKAAPRPRGVGVTNPNVQKLPRPSRPEGVSQREFGDNVIEWGAGPNGAVDRLSGINADSVSSMRSQGLTEGMARFLR